MTKEIILSLFFLRWGKFKLAWRYFQFFLGQVRTRLVGMKVRTF